MEQHRINIIQKKLLVEHLKLPVLSMQFVGSHCLLTLLQEAYAFRDPVTEFVECLYVNYDFDRAQKKLLECDKVITSSSGI